MGHALAILMGLALLNPPILSIFSDTGFLFMEQLL